MKPSLYVPILAYGPVDPVYMMSMFSLLRSKVPIGMTGLYQDSLISRSRNRVASNMLDMDLTHLLFIDCDIVFDPADVQRLIDADEDVVCGLYPLKQLTHKPVINYPGKEHPTKPLIKVGHAGTGFMLIKKSVLEKLAVDERSYHPYKNEKGVRSVCYDFFPVKIHQGKDGPEYFSEDWGFCHICEEAGIDIWVDPAVQVGHRGTIQYPLSLPDMEEALKYNKSILEKVDVKRPTHYRSIPGWFDFADLYEDIVEHHSDGSVFVEVGAFKGRSTAYMAELIKLSGKKIKFNVVDTWQGSPEHQKGAPDEDKDVVDGSLFDAFTANMKPLAKYYKPIQAESVEASWKFEDKSLDFVFIDADHSTEAVTADIQAWLPKIKPGGVIAGHDYNYPSVQEGVHKFFDPSSVQGGGTCWVVQTDEE